MLWKFIFRQIEQSSTQAHYFCCVFLSKGWIFFCLDCFVFWLFCQPFDSTTCHVFSCYCFCTSGCRKVKCAIKRNVSEMCQMIRFSMSLVKRCSFSFVTAARASVLVFFICLFELTTKRHVGGGFRSRPKLCVLFSLCDTVQGIELQRSVCREISLFRS